MQETRGKGKGGMPDRWAAAKGDAGKVGCGKGRMQERWDAGKVGCRKRRDAG